MATKSKKTIKSKKPIAPAMKTDKVEKVDVKKLIKDERSHKIAGTFFILIGLLLLIAFTSYLFTWQQDQSKVLQGAKILLPANDQPMANSLGTAGAYLSDLFFRSGFGIASFLFCLFFFVVGINLFAPRRIFSVGRNLRYVIAGLIVISVSASFLMHTPHAHIVPAAGPEFFWGGRVGDMINEWLQQMIGYVGTAALLFVCLLSYIIWRFNPSFNFKKPDFSRKDIFPSFNEETPSPLSEAMVVDKYVDGNKFSPITHDENDAKDFEEEFELTEKEDEIPASQSIKAVDRRP
ncbi:MAG: DNA translocase FtsK 4TM domain-containing protein, partial [Ginsengibacter sp.]